MSNIEKPLLQVSGLTKRFLISEGYFPGKKRFLHAVEDISFTLNHGETLGIVGESGCGKTTTGRLILQLVRPTAGYVSLNGCPNLSTMSERSLRPYRKHMQMVFQDPFSSLNPRMTVGSIVREALDIHKLGEKASRPRRVLDLLDEVGLPPSSINRFPHEFSGGQRQRIGIARALAVQPSLIIADEPVSALDVSIQSQIINLLEDIQQRHRIGLLFIAHDLSVVAHISHRVAVMYLGRIVEIGPTSEVYNTPKHPYTQSLLQAVPRLEPGRKCRRTLMSGDVPSPITPPSGCPFHPRCPHAIDICKTTCPTTTVHGDSKTHHVTCHLYTDSFSKTAGKCI